jgi:V/A-type H+-transporting ATPase subunit D
MAENIIATRAELIKTKGRIKLAQSGHRLLKKKRDGLIKEFFTLLAQVQHLREELDERYRIALNKMNLARILEGDIRVESAAFAVREQPSLEMSKKSIIGVSVPKIQGRVTHTRRSYFDSIAITEAAEQYEKLLAKIIEAAEIETAIRKLLAEIEKTKRRVNALEFEIVPALQHRKAAIALRLDEIERENFYRLKISKRKLAA